MPGNRIDCRHRYDLRRLRPYVLRIPAMGMRTHAGRLFNSYTSS